MNIKPCGTFTKTFKKITYCTDLFIILTSLDMLQVHYDNHSVKNTAVIVYVEI